MKMKLDKGAILPTRAHPYDAGLDLYAPNDVLVKSGTAIGGRAQLGSAVIDTGVHVQIPEGYVGLINGRSSMNVQHGLTCEGVIDAGYTGAVLVKLYNYTAFPYFCKRGDKIAQLVIVPCLLPELEQTWHLEATERGDGGFGSSGR